MINLKDIKLSQYQEFMTGYKEEMEDKQRFQLVWDVFGDGDTPSFLKLTKFALEVSEALQTPQELTVAFNGELVGVEDMEFGFIPDLEGSTFGEIIDMDNYLPNIEDHHKLMAILYRPISAWKGNKYRIDEYKDTDEFGELMKDMPLHIYLGALTFFETLGLALQNAFPSYFKETEAQKMATSFLQNKLSDLSGTGTKAWSS